MLVCGRCTEAIKSKVTRKINSLKYIGGSLEVGNLISRRKMQRSKTQIMIIILLLLATKLLSL